MHDLAKTEYENRGLSLLGALRETFFFFAYIMMKKTAPSMHRPHEKHECSKELFNFLSNVILKGVDCVYI